jgi:hypothetical protein
MDERLTDEATVTHSMEWNNMRGALLTELCKLHGDFAQAMPSDTSPVAWKHMMDLYAVQVNEKGAVLSTCENVNQLIVQRTSINSSCN